jgi:hypothetical protein
VVGWNELQKRPLTEIDPFTNYSIGSMTEKLYADKKSARFYQPPGVHSIAVVSLERRYARPLTFQLAPIWGMYPLTSG